MPMMLMEAMHGVSTPNKGARTVGEEVLAAVIVGFVLPKYHIVHRTSYMIRLTYV